MNTSHPPRMLLRVPRSNRVPGFSRSGGLRCSAVTFPGGLPALLEAGQRTVPTGIVKSAGNVALLSRRPEGLPAPPAFPSAFPCAAYAAPTFRHAGQGKAIINQLTEHTS